MTKSEFEALPTAEAMLDVFHANPELWNDMELRKLFCSKAAKEFEQSVIEVFGSYDPEIHYDFSKRKKD